MKSGKVKRTLFILAVVAVIVTICIFKIQKDMENKYFGHQAEEIVLNVDAVADQNSFNALLLGTDKGGTRTDAIMLVNVNKSEKTINMLSIPRDTKVTVNGKKRKINSVYGSYGVDMLISEVKELTHAPVNYYAVIEPGVLADIVDCLGGVEYEVERDMSYSDPSQDLYIDLKAGLQTLSGDQAEQYCRYRSYKMGDIERTEAQKRFFTALFEQKLNIKNITKIGAMYNAISQKVETNVTFKDIADNIDVMKIISDGGTIESIETPGAFNDMQKEGVSYFLIYNNNLVKLRQLCGEYFDGTVN